MSFSRFAPLALRAARPSAIRLASFSAVSSRPLLSSAALRPLSFQLPSRSFSSSPSPAKAEEKKPVVEQKKEEKKEQQVVEAAPIVSSSSSSHSFSSDLFNGPVRPLRPISPHVSIYAFPVAALSSISNRVTGVALAAIFYVVGLGAFYDVDLYALTNFFKDCHYVQLATPALKALVAFPAAYHTLAGARHMFWDKTARELELSSVLKSSIGLFAASALLALLASQVTLKAYEPKPFWQAKEKKN